MPGPKGVPRADIIALIRAGHSNREIGRILHIGARRVSRTRNEEGLPDYVPPTPPSLEAKWAANTRPVLYGHVRWTGGIRGRTPNLVHQGRNWSARRVAFLIGHGREPVGRVLPGCGQTWCVAPEHATDEVTRRSDAMYSLIFGSAA
jgi:hypothetical protein